MGSLKWLLLFACCLTASANQPSPQMVAEIYKNAPPIVQAALRNVGLSAPKFKNPNININQLHRSPPPSQRVAIPRPPTMMAAGHGPSLLPKPLPAPPTITSRQSHDPSGREPFVVIQPMSLSNGRNSRAKSNRRLVLAFPKDNVQILNAEIPTVNMNSVRKLAPGALTLSIRDARREAQTPEREHYNNREGSKEYTPSPHKFYASQIPPPPRYRGGRQQSASIRNPRVHYGFIPMTNDGDRHDDEEEDIPFRFQQQDDGRSSDEESSEDYEDLISSPGGRVTVLNAQKLSPKLISGQKASSQSFEPMKAIVIQPQSIQAKRVTVMEAEARKVTPMKATMVQAERVESMGATLVKPKSVKSGSFAKSKTHRHDRAQLMKAPSVVSVLNENTQETGESRMLGDGNLPLDPDNEVPPIDLQCGGNNDLGWCDLGQHYPISEVGQIMEVCEELVSRMYVETPPLPELMEDTLSYSLSHNISDHFSKRRDRNWGWDGRPTPFQGSMCEVIRNFIRPSFAQDIRGKWHVIIQTDRFPQRVPLEVCRNPGEPCPRSEGCSRLSQCVQKYTYQHLISFDPESAETCPFVRLYKFPSACVCRVQTHSDSAGQ